MIKFLLPFLVSFSAFGDVPPPLTTSAKVQDGFGNKITSTVTGPSRGLDVNVLNASSSTVTQGPAGASPWLFDLTRVGGSAITLGQKTMANSIPIVIASDQTSIPVTGPLTDAQLRASAVPVSLTSVPLPTGAATEATLSAFKSANHSDLLSVISTLGSPFQAGGSIGNTSFIANAGTNLNTSALNLEATQSAFKSANHTDLLSINTTLGTPAQEHTTAGSPHSVRLTDGTSFYTGFKSGDSIGNTSFIANAGTNLNTSALALSANQTNGTQKTQIVDGSGNVITSTLVSSKQRLDVTLASAGADGSPAPTHSNLSGGIDNGGNQQAISVDTTGRVNTNTFDGTGTAITSSTVNGKTGMSSIVSGADVLNVTGSGSALNATPIPDTNVVNYRCASIQRTLAGTNTITFEESNDDVTFTATTCSNNATANVSPTTTSAATATYICPIHAARFRTRISAFTSGSSTENANFYPFPCSDLAQKNVAGTGTFTVSGTVNTNPATFTFSTQVANAARTTSANSGNITQAAPNNQVVFELNVTAVSGTNPTLDLVFQESPDNGTTWVDEWHWQRVTATGQFYTPNLTLNTSHFRFVWTIGGTTPSFTFSVGSNQGNQVGQIQRRFFDRTINLNSANSTSAAWLTDGCLSFNITLNDSACTTFPTLAIQSSEDNSNWATTLGVLATAANGTSVSSASQQPAHFSRIITTTAGTTCTLGFVALRCTQY